MRFTGLLILMLAYMSSLQAQELHADFMPNIKEGCSPLTVSFFDHSQGASSTAIYQWDLGNGNTSALKEPAAFYKDEKTYSVTLTIKDGAKTSSKTKTITVYKRPVADFIFSPDKGCLPMAVSFTSTSTTDGGISAYNWDFGDGIAVQLGSNGSSTAHAFFLEQAHSVTLTVLNSFGCAATVTKKDIIKVGKPLRAGFDADKTILCNAPGTVVFSNTTTGPGVLSYEWDFGDGNTSTLAAPTHSYANKGVYTVKLRVTSSEGCTDIIEKMNFINVAEFTTDFTIPSPICTQQFVTFNNASQPSPNSSTWMVDGNNTYGSGNGSMTTQFLSAGTHTVELINNFGVCQQKATKTIDVKKTPVVNGFIEEITGKCGAPVRVNFKDTTTGAVSWKWNFNYWTDNNAVHATTREPSFTYPSDNNYQVNLTVTTADGCSNSTIKYVGISRPLVNVAVVSGNPFTACGPLGTKFEVRSTESISSYQWQFSDGSTSTEASPQHTFNNPGRHSVVLNYVTVNGCTGIASLSDLYVFPKPVADFSSLSGTTICGNTPVRFRSDSTNASNEAWYINGVYAGTSSSREFVHQFTQAGKYTIKLIAYNGSCLEEITKTDYIEVLPPFPKIASSANTCEGERNVITFTDASVNAQGWNWDFGDGANSSYNVQSPTVQHTYPATGKYKVVLTTTNGSCSVRDSVQVFVLLKQKPVLAATKSVLCNEEELNYTISNLQQTPYDAVWVSYFFSKWQYGDGSNFTGTNSDYTGFVHPLPFSGKLNYFDKNQDKLRVVVLSSYFNCLDTSNYIPISFKGAKAGFEVVTDNVCFKTPVVLRDTSKTQAGNPIVSWTWDFGDGVVETKSQGGTVSHTYLNPGFYNVKLKVTDASGCTATADLSASQNVRVTGPKVSFSPLNSSVQLNTNISFYNSTNTSNAYNISWQWDFGTGATSTQPSPGYTFTQPGEYTVSLTAVNNDNQCTDKMTGKITVMDFKTGFTKTVSMIGDYNRCAPALVRFQNTSYNYTRLEWDFGDGFTLVDQVFPIHIYEKPGEYEVVLKVYGYNGLMDIYRDVVRISLPSATIDVEDLTGCIGHMATLNAPTQLNASSYTWDFGDGNIVTGTENLVKHEFKFGGTFTPSLIVKDAAGCPFAVTSSEKIVIHPDPLITIVPAEAVVCKSVPVRLEASGGQTYSWSPVAGLSAADIASPMAVPATNTTYQVQSTDANGCKGGASVTITVPTPFSMDGVTSAEVCKGSNIQLNVKGADSYKWINTTTGLSSTSIPDPVASPDATTLYKVVGYDKYTCYSDTIDITVNVRPQPTVNAGPDQQIVFGATAQLAATNSADVTRWNWSPDRYLNCASCPDPVSKPYESMQYVVTVSNQYNCIAKDTVLVKAVCGGDHIFIPNAFTPNNDGKNDQFTVFGQGVSNIRSMRVYNRWGEIVFEKKNFHPNDISSAWNGRYKGLEAPAGSYVYFAEMECEAGMNFERKGSVMLIR